ncbi:MAG: hypothetical protein HUU02_02750 [Bacteroidetes bacterium]|nr:hypothetical protein [Bacteroidota bacterium]
MMPPSSLPVIAAAVTILFLNGCDMEPDVSLLNLHDPFSAQYVPTLPTGLDANTGLDSVVNLGWYDESLGEEGFVVERRLGNPGVFTRIATLPPNTTRYADSLTLPIGQLFGYRVGVLLHGAVTGYTNAFPVTFNAYPPGLRGTFTASTVVRINIDLFSPFRSWTLERSVDGGSYTVFRAEPSSVRQVFDSTLTAPHTYLYRGTATTGRNITEYSAPLGVKYSNGNFIFFTP